MKTLLKSGGTLTIGVLLLFGLASNTLQQRPRETTICPTCVKDSFKGVNLDALVRNVARYRGTHLKLVEANMEKWTLDQKRAARTCTYTLDTLKKFICLIETYSKQASINPKDLAIRFAYGVYPKDEKVYNEKYGSLHTLFMIPAKYDSVKNVFVEFDPKATAEKDPVYVKNLRRLDFKPVYQDFYALADLAPLASRDPSIRFFALDATSMAPPTPTSTTRSTFSNVRSSTSNAQSSGANGQSSAPTSTQSAQLRPVEYVWNQGMLCPPNCPDIDFLGTVDSLYPNGIGW